jgi:hypothetical protein
MRAQSQENFLSTRLPGKRSDGGYAEIGGDVDGRESPAFLGTTLQNPLYKGIVRRDPDRGAARPDLK